MERNAPVAPLPLPPRFAVSLVLWLRRALRQLSDAIVPAQLAVYDRVVGFPLLQLVRALGQLGVLQALSDGAKTAEELARPRGLDSDATHRALRALATDGLVRMDADGRFSLTRLSRILTPGEGAFAPFVDYFGSRSNTLAWLDIAQTLRTGEGAFRRVNGDNIWDYFARHPDEERVFAETMAALTAQDSAAVVRAYPKFGSFKRICDVAGGRGMLLAEILRRCPDTRGVLMDARSVLEGSTGFLGELGVLDRVQLHPGNFFDPASIPRGCDLYLLKDILHDWDDARSLQILKNVRAAMEEGARVLVVEVPVERLSTDHPGTLIDLQMMMVCEGGRQRSEGEFGELFRRTGFAPRGVYRTPLPVAVIEAEAI